MLLDISGEWIYIFSGKLPQIEEEDVYMFCRTIRLSEITGMEVNYELCTIKLFIKGFESFVFLSFQENLSNFKTTLQKLVTALGMNSKCFTLQ